MKIITLIASHIECKKRLHNLIKLIKNINEQIDYFDDIDVRISLSHDVEIDKEEIIFLLNSVNKLNLKIHYHDSKLYQFEHYKFLTNQLEIDDDTWILFSDDDDEWAENRLAAYHYMINYLKDKDIQEYNRITAVCYTNENNKNGSNYIGSYVDYCIKFKYLKIFIEYATDEQLKHKFCDCYFVKFIHMYGIGILKHAFSATDDILYNWIKYTDADYNKHPKHMHFEEILADNLDLYIAQYTNPNVTDWLKFCFLYCENKMNNKTITTEMKRYMIKLYLDNYENHIFANKYLPVL